MIKDLALGKVEFAAMVVSAEIRQTKAGENFGVFEVRDRSASIKLMVFQWDQRDRTVPKPGNILSVDGVIEEYKGSRQCKVNDFGYLAPQQVNMADFLPTSERPAEELHAELVGKVKAQIESEPIRNMLVDMLTDTAILPALLRSPAAKFYHHARCGGLLEHMLSLWGLADAVSLHYGKIVDRDILLAYCVLHDFAKTRELVVESGFDYSPMGVMVGHVIIGSHILFHYAKKHKVSPGAQVKLLHGVASHHGEFGEIQPKTVEAVIFHYLDQIDAKTEAIRTALADDTTLADKVNVPALKGDIYR